MSLVTISNDAGNCESHCWAAVGVRCLVGSIGFGFVKEVLASWVSEILGLVFVELKLMATATPGLVILVVNYL